MNRDNARAGAMMAFGQPVNTIYDFDQADRILSLDCDFLSALARVTCAMRATLSRAGASPKTNSEMSRLYVVETTPTTQARAPIITGR